MAFMGPALSAVGNAAGSLFGTSSASAAAGAAGMGAGAAGAGLSGAAGASLTPAAMGASMGYGAPTAAGAATTAAAPASSGFFSGAVDSLGLTTDGKYDAKKAGGLVGSLLGQAATQPGQSPGAPDVRMADFPQAVQQAMGQKPWATGQYDSYLKQLMGGG